MNMFTVRYLPLLSCLELVSESSMNLVSTGHKRSKLPKVHGRLQSTMSGPTGPPATIAGGPSKRLPRPPCDPWRRGNKEVSRARCALCAPAYAPPRAPSVRRIDPPRAHCCPRRPMLSTSSAATPSWTRSRLGASETNETKLFIGATRAVPAWHGARERVTAAALQQLREGLARELA